MKLIFITLARSFINQLVKHQSNVGAPTHIISIKHYVHVSIKDDNGNFSFADTITNSSHMTLLIDVDAPYWVFFPIFPGILLAIGHAKHSSS